MQLGWEMSILFGPLCTLLRVFHRTVSSEYDMNISNVRNKMIITIRLLIISRVVQDFKALCRISNGFSTDFAPRFISLVPAESSSDFGASSLLLTCSLESLACSKLDHDLVKLFHRQPNSNTTFRLPNAKKLQTSSIPNVETTFFIPILHVLNPFPCQSRDEPAKPEQK